MGFNFAVGFSFLFSLVYVDYFKNSDISSYFCGASVIWVTGAATCADPDLSARHSCISARIQDSLQEATLTLKLPIL